MKQFILLYICVSEGHPHRHWSWGLHSLHRHHGGWHCCGSCSLPPAWSSWPSWPLRWLRWQLLPPPLSGLERRGRGDRALTHSYVSAGAEPLHLQNLSETCTGKLKKTKKKRTLEIKQWIILYTMGNKRLWDHSLVFHLLTGDIFTAGYHADGIDPCVCGSIWFLWMFHPLRHSLPHILMYLHLDGKRCSQDNSTWCKHFVCTTYNAYCMCI